MLRDTETEATSVGEVLLDKFVLLHLEARLLREKNEKGREGRQRGGELGDNFLSKFP